MLRVNAFASHNSMQDYSRTCNDADVSPDGMHPVHMPVRMLSHLPCSWSCWLTASAPINTPMPVQGKAQEKVKYCAAVQVLCKLIAFLDDQTLLFSFD